MTLIYSPFVSQYPCSFLNHLSSQNFFFSSQTLFSSAFFIWAQFFFGRHWKDEMSRLFWKWSKSIFSFYYKLFTNKKNILSFIYIYHYLHFFQKWTHFQNIESLTSTAICQTTFRSNTPVSIKHGRIATLQINWIFPDARNARIIIKQRISVRFSEINKCFEHCHKHDTTTACW